MRGTATDGVDKIRNIELLQFTDRVINLTGEPVISDETPLEGEELTALPGTIALFNGISEEAITFQWQSANGGGFTDIQGATGTTFTPTQAQAGLTLRVVAKFTDSTGIARTVVAGDRWAISSPATTWRIRSSAP